MPLGNLIKRPIIFVLSVFCFFIHNYIKSKSNALWADDVRVPVNGPVSELDLFGSCSGASPQLQVGVVDSIDLNNILNGFAVMCICLFFFVYMIIDILKKNEK